MVNCFVNNGCANLESTIEITEDLYKKIDSNQDVVNNMAKDLGLNHYHMLSDKNTCVSVAGWHCTESFDPIAESEKLNIAHNKLLHQIMGLEIKEQDVPESVDVDDCEPDNVQVIHVVHHIVFEQQEENILKETTCDVVLKDAGPNKLNVIKGVADVCDLSLKEAKDLVDDAPITITGLSSEKAKILKKFLEENEAVVDIVEREEEIEEPLVSVELCNVERMDRDEYDTLLRMLKSITDVKRKYLDQKCSQTPVTLIDNVSEDVAEVLKRIFEEFGATIKIIKE